MLDPLGRIRWRALALVVSVLLLAPSAGQSQGLQELFGFKPADPNAASATETNDAAASPAATDGAPSAQENAAPRRPRRAARSGEGKPARRASSETYKNGQGGSLGERTNSNTVAIISGDRGATSAAVADDLSAVLDSDDLRVLPILGKGGAQNIRDVRFMKGVDLGITQSNLLGHFKRSNEIGPIDGEIVYLAKLFNEEMHVVVRTEGGPATIEELSGQRVNFGEAGSGTQMTAREVFGRLGVKPVEVNLDQAQALQELEAGRLAASVIVSGKPVAAVSRLTGQGFKLLPVPYAKELRDDYLPATLTAEDYPGLAAPVVDTVAVSTVLIAYNWPKGSDRYRRLEKFVATFFPRVADLQAPPRHAKWRETNLAAVLPGWRRFGAAEEWLRRNRGKVADWRDYNGFFAAGNADAGPSEDGRLFQEFLKWNRDRKN
jgi:TRAP transporter TAXI family solute receptor